MATKLTFINANNETESLLKAWENGNIVTSNRLNHIQAAITNLDTALLGTERNSTAGMTTLENMLQVTSNQVTIGNAAVITNSTTSPNSVATFNVSAALTVGGNGSGEDRNLVVNGIASANSYNGTGNTIILNKGTNINGSLTVGNSGNLSVAGDATITGQATIKGTIIENNKITLAASQATTDVGNNELVSKALLDTTISTAISTAIDALDSNQAISNDGYHIINSITLTDGKLTNLGTTEIPTATASQKGLMTGDQYTKLSQLGIKFTKQSIINNSDSELEIVLNNNELPVQNTSFTTTQVGSTIGSIAVLGTIVTDVEPIITKVNSLSTIIDNVTETIAPLQKVNSWPLEDGDYKLHVVIKDDGPVYTWVPIDDNGGEST